MDTLTVISQKILDGIPFSSAEEYFLKAIIYKLPEGSGTPPYGGWYSRLFYLDLFHHFKGLMEKDNIVADIHTVTTDCSGGVIGAIPHVGTGSVNLGVFIAEVPGNQTVAFIGPFLSYYEYRTYNFERLTDQEWDDTYLQSALRPDWVNIYLADGSGNTRGDGPSLLTSVDDFTGVNIPSSELIINNYPNPFNPSTIIHFNIPSSLSNSNVELIIYNINGEVIKHLVNEILPSGNYLVRWDGKNDLGNSVSSGIYIYNLRAESKIVSGKMTLLK